MTVAVADAADVDGDRCKRRASSAQLGVERNVEQRLNQSFRREGVYGERPIVLELRSVEERWLSPILWSLELEAIAGYQDKKSPIIRYRYLGRIEYPQQLGTTRQRAYSNMYQSIAEQVLSWVFVQKDGA